MTYGVARALGAGGGRRAGREGRTIEVIDLRSLLPWDAETVLRVGAEDRPLPRRSTRRRDRRLRRRSRGGRRARGLRVARRAGARLGALDTPVPSAQALEEIFSPKARLLPALRALLEYQPRSCPSRPSRPSCRHLTR